MSKIVKTQGMGGLYGGILPIMCKQVSHICFTFILLLLSSLYVLSIRVHGLVLEGSALCCTSIARCVCVTDCGRIPPPPFFIPYAGFDVHIYIYIYIYIYMYIHSFEPNPCFCRRMSAYRLPPHLHLHDALRIRCRFEAFAFFFMRMRA
jgi:hypothetical protein